MPCVRITYHRPEVYNYLELSSLLINLSLMHTVFVAKFLAINDKAQ